MANLQRDFPFRRYLVPFQGAVRGAPDGCNPPIPTIKIGCTANLQLVDTDDTVACDQQGSDLLCTGSGRVLVDCVARNNLNDLTTGLALNVEMETPINQDFQSCNDVDFLGQGFGVGIVCPDGSVTFDTLACFPISSFVPGEIPTCFSRCSGECSDPSDLPGINGEVLSTSSCLWRPEDVAPSPAETPAPTPSPTPAPVPAPETPSPTPAPDPASTLSPTTSSPTDFQTSIVATAENEFQVYQGRDECTDSLMRGRIAEYWAFFENLNLDWDGCSGQPWSAAFISFMVSEAGSGDQFFYSVAHRDYIRDSIMGGSGLYNSAVDVVTTVPKLGDLACQGVVGTETEGWTYQQFVNWANSIYTTIPTHCDIVVEVDGNSTMTLIGGNVGSQVKRFTVEQSTYAILLEVNVPNTAPVAPTSSPVNQPPSAADMPSTSPSSAPSLRGGPTSAASSRKIASFLISMVIMSLMHV